MALNKKRNQRTTIEVWLGILLLAMSFCTLSKQVVTYPIEKAISIVPNTVSVEHGLSQNSVTVMKLDSYSRLWVGTQEGLNLFDLNGVELVGQAPHLTQLSGRVIQGLAQDQRGNMWVATNRGLDKIKVSDLSVENILQKSDAGAVRQLDCMSDGRLVYLSDGVLYLLDPNTHQSTKLAGITGQAVYFFAYKDVLLVRLQDSIIAYNPNTQQSQAYPLQPDEARLALSFSRTQTGELLMLTAQNKLKACSFTRCREVVVQYGDKQLEFRRIRHFGDKFTAITNIGVVIGSADFDNLTLINTPFPDMLYPTFSQRAGIALRQDGAILIGNYRGVFEIPANYQSVSSFTSEQFLGSETIFATGKLETAQGERLVIAGESTLFITAVNREKLTVEQQFSIPQGMNGRHLIALNGRTYLASDNKGVFEVTIAGLVEVDNSKLAQSLTTPLIIDMYAIDQHNTLILQNATLSKQSTQSGVAEVVWSVTLPTFSSYRLLYKSGYLFVATLDRGILYQQVEDGFTKPSQSWRSLLEHDIALDLYDVTPSQLLVMSVESGAVLVEKRKQNWTIAKTLQSASHPPLTTLCGAQTQTGEWLLTTNSGILIYDNTLELDRFFTKLDGIGVREYQQFGCGQVGEFIYAQGHGGITLMPKSSASLPHSEIALNLVGAWQDEQILPINNQNIVAVAPDLVKLKFALAPLPLDARAQIQYRFDSERNWQTASSSTLLFSHLTEDKYMLQVRAKSYNGMMSPTRQFELLILPPWWRSPAAYSIYLSAFLILLWASYRYRLNKQQAYARQLEQQVAERTLELQHKQQEALALHQEKARFINEASHDLKHLCGLIKLNVSNLDLPLDEHFQGVTKTAIQGATSQLSQLVNNVVEISHLDAGMISPRLEAVSINALFFSIEQQFMIKCRDKQISIESQVAGPLFCHSDEHLLSRLLFNLVDNAVKSLRSGDVIKLQASHDRETLIIAIVDSGPGLSPDIVNSLQAALSAESKRVVGTGLGLSIVVGITRLLNIGLVVDSGSTGTKFILKFEG